MRAKFFINLPVLSFGEQMQIDVAHDWPVLIRIPRELFWAVRFYDAEMVWNVALCVGSSGAKETFLIDPFRSDRFVRFSIEQNLHRARVREKNPDLHVFA